MNSGPAFSRASDDQNGKCDVRIDTPIPESVKEDAAFVARAQGFNSTSAWVRYLIERELYGAVAHIQSVVRGSARGDGKNIP